MIINSVVMVGVGNIDRPMLLFLFYSVYICVPISLKVLNQLTVIIGWLDQPIMTFLPIAVTIIIYVFTIIL